MMCHLPPAETWGDMLAYTSSRACAVCEGGKLICLLILGTHPHDLLHSTGETRDALQ